MKNGHTDAFLLTKANRKVCDALRAINDAADAIGEMAAYYNASDIFHASTVEKYNKLISAALTLKEYQTR